MSTYLIGFVVAGRCGGRHGWTYLGRRHEGKLVAMAGERLHPAGWTEISAVCTDAAFRGQGLATRLVRAVGAIILITTVRGRWRLK